jgi:HK97 family phage major capsid protein
MPYNSLISRTDAAAMIPEEISQLMLAELGNVSAVLSLGTRVPVARNQTRFPVLSALPTAYFVNGDTGLKQTTEAAWDNKYLNIEEIAAIVPIPESVLDDVGFDMWAATRPLLEQAIGRSLDAAVFFGTNAPAAWPTNIVTSAVAAGNVVARGTTTQANGGLAADLVNLFGTVWADGYDVTGVVGNTTIRPRLLNARDAQGNRYGDQLSLNEVLGAPTQYPMRGQWPTGLSAAELIAGDFQNLVVGVRQDFTYKIITEGVITDAGGLIQYNLPQQDMIALRIVFRVGWAVANPINYDQATEASRYPFAVLRSPAA